MALDDGLESATPTDLPTLWNLAYADASQAKGNEQERIVNRIGQLLNRWPAAIKSTKLPPWDQSFAEDWWTLIKESMAEGSNQGSSKKAEDDAAKFKAEEAAKAATDKEAEEAKSKQPDVKTEPKTDPKAEPVQKSQPKNRGK